MELLDKQMANKILWNKGKTAFVLASKIREVQLYERLSLITHREYYEVKGWYNESRDFYFGEFQTKEEAQKFMEELQIELAK